MFVADSKEKFTNYDLDFVLLIKYSASNEVPLKYHELKAEFIVHLSRNAGHVWMPKGEIAEDIVMSEKIVHNEEN